MQNLQNQPSTTYGQSGSNANSHNMGDVDINLDAEIIETTQYDKPSAPIAVVIATVINYAGAMSLLAILWSLFFNPGGSTLGFNSDMHDLFLFGPGELLYTMYSASSFFGGAIMLLVYFVALVLYCWFILRLAGNLLRGMSHARIIQINISSITVLLSPVILFKDSIVGIFVLTVNILIIATFLFSNSVKDFFASNAEKSLSAKKRNRVVLYSVIYFLILLGVLMLLGKYYDATWKEELNELPVTTNAPSQVNSDNLDNIHQSSSQDQHLSGQEMVMSGGMEIAADVPKYGVIKIYADDAFTRTYSWENCTRQQTLNPRGKRWLGSFGAYFPGPNPSWKSCDGISGALLEEGQQHFETEEKALAWILSKSTYSDDGIVPDFETEEDANKWLLSQMDIVYSSDGLVIRFDPHVPGNGSYGILKVEVWQVYINGSKPSQLRWSSDDRITVEYR